MKYYKVENERLKRQSENASDASDKEAKQRLEEVQAQLKESKKLVDKAQESMKVMESSHQVVNGSTFLSSNQKEFLITSMW